MLIPDPLCLCVSSFVNNAEMIACDYRRCCGDCRRCCGGVEEEEIGLAEKSINLHIYESIL